MGITLGQKTVEFKPQKVYGAECVGGYCLYFPIEMRMPTFPEEEVQAIFLRNLSMDVKFQNKLLGFATPERSVTYQPYPSYARSEQLVFRLMLSNQQMESIEQLRLGGDLNFAMQITGEYGDISNKSMSAQEWLDIKVAQSDWVTLLKNMGYGRYFLLELPIDIPQSDKSARALKEFEEAKKQFFYGHYNECVMACRKILEFILKESSLRGLRSRYADSQDSRKMTKDERILNFYDALKHVSHLGVHLEEEETDELHNFTRAEAFMILCSTATSLASFTIQLTANTPAD